MDSAQPDAQTPIGTPVHLDFRKYDGAEHWQEHYSLLGVDDFGVWLGMEAGTPFARPGMSVVARTNTVRLLPPGARWAACFNAPDPGRLLKAHIYVDITTPVQWSHDAEGFHARMVDVDLDVVERFSGELFIDDEDEFADHTVEFGYPADLVEATEAAARDVLAAVRERRPPFDGTGDSWLTRIRP